MRNVLPFVNNGISMIEETHTYHDGSMDEYTPVSSILKSLKEPFPTEERACMVARSRLGWNTATKEMIEVEKLNVIKEWNDKKEESIIWGKKIHNGLESFVLNGYCDDENIMECGKIIYEKYLSQYKKIYCEAILHHYKTMSAGTADLVLERPISNSKLIVDVGDYKTNQYKGIEYDGMKYDEKKLKWKYYYNTFLDPISHLEYCNYIEYSLQLSFYAYFLEVQYGLTIGKLFIIFIDDNYNPSYIPCVYLKSDIEKILSHRMVNELKPLPEVNEEYDNW